MRRGHRRGLTLLEVIVALGVLAVGATAAFALLVAAAAAGRRAEHNVNASLVAETILNDVKGELGLPLRLEDYPLASEVPPLPDVDPDPDQPPPNPETRYLERDATWSAYPAYRYDIAITPLPGPVPDEPWQFLLEVEVRWSTRGKRRSVVHSTVVLRTVSPHDPLPTPTR